MRGIKKNDRNKMKSPPKRNIQDTPLIHEIVEAIFEDLAPICDGGIIYEGFQPERTNGNLRPDSPTPPKGNSLTGGAMSSE